MSKVQMNGFPRWAKETALGLAVSLLYALFSSLYLLLFFHFVARIPIHFSLLVPSEFLYGALWVFFFFFVRRIIRVLRAGDGGKPFRLLVQALLALLVPPAHLIIYFWLNVVLEPLGIIYIPAMGLIDQAFFDNLFNNYILYGVVMAMILFFDTLKKNRELELQRLQAELQQARLQNLKTRLRPDYIFPVFRRLESLVASQPERAFTLMSKLSCWLRAIQDVSTCSLIPFEEEIRLFRAYLDMESFIRGFACKPDLRIDPEALAWPVPPMFLQTSLECVFKDAAGPEDAAPGIEVTGSAAGGCLALRIRVSGRKISPAREVAGSGSTGILRDQLSVLYGGDYLLDHALGSEGEMEIEMRLPWSEMRPRGEGR